jgi:hypothetical protein
MAIGTLEPEAWLGDRKRWTEHVFDSFHPAGTARMTADGVVDSDCRVREPAISTSAGA